MDVVSAGNRVVLTALDPRDLETLARWAAELGVRTQAIEARRELLATGERVRWQWRMASDPASLRALWGRIGYEYNFRRQHEAACALQYVKYKEQVVRQRQEAVRLLRRWRAAGVSVGEATRRLADQDINRRFVERTYYEQRGDTPRIGDAVCSYAAFRRERQNGQEPLGCVWEEIVRIEPVERPELRVYDLTVDHPDHNFIANGICVHNCVRPNAQQLPRSGGFRACFTADPGEMIISADFSGVAVRVAAALSQDESLMRFIRDEDEGLSDGLHWAIARAVWGPDAGKDKRYLAKGLAFGTLY
ncbi:MAG: DNA polymerase, partial [Symbiobacteriaceae bacterium]